MLGFLKFLVFALAFVAVLTVVVRLARLRVHSDLTLRQGARADGCCSSALVLAVWWFLTRGEPGERMVQPLILPSPLEVLQAFVPLHLEQGLVRSAFSSWLRVTCGLSARGVGGGAAGGLHGDVSADRGVFPAAGPGRRPMCRSWCSSR